MRYIRYMLIFLAITGALLCGCQSKYAVENDRYAIYRENGKYYMSIYCDLSAPTGGEPGEYESIALSPPTFASLADMKQRIVSGGLSDSELYVLSKNGSVRTFEICNLWDLQDIALPQGLSYDRILWYGSYYTFEIPTGGISVTVCGKKDYDRLFADNYTEEINHESRSVFSDTVVPDRDARAIQYMTDAGICKDLCYTIHPDHGKATVLERYTLELFDTDPPQGSETVPERVWMFSEGKDRSLIVSAYGLTERPSAEWLSAFKLK